MRGRKAFMHAANRNRDRNSDAKKIDALQLGIPYPTVRERTIYHQSFTQARKERTPDLVETDSNVIIELDGPVHGSMDGASESRSTLARNADFERAGLNYVILNEALAESLDLDMEKLAIYLIEHEKSKKRARREAEG